MTHIIQPARTLIVGNNREYWHGVRELERSTGGTVDYDPKLLPEDMQEEAEAFRERAEEETHPA